jgi:hypothetical protein
MRKAVASENNEKIGKRKPPVKGAMMKQTLRLSGHGEAVSNAAVALGVELHALSQSLVVRHHIGSCCNGKSPKAKHCCYEAEGSKVFHG